MELNLAKKNLPFAFTLCMGLFLTLPLLFPHLKLFFFAPFIVVLIYQKSKGVSCCIALLTGLVLDLFSIHESIPFYAINTCLTVFLLYDQRQHFFGDSVSTLPIMVYFFGVLSSLLQGVLIETLGSHPHLSLHWIAFDVVLFPLADALFAFLIFTLPVLLFGKRTRRGSEYFNG